MSPTDVFLLLAVFGVMVALISVARTAAGGGKEAGSDAAAQAQLVARLHALEHQVAQILEHLGLDVPAAGAALSAKDLARVRRELEADRRVRAIKIYRECSGTDLLSAKDQVDQLAREWGLSVD